jgi:hypothetical protein
MDLVVEINFYRFLGFIFSIAGIIILMVNHRLARQLKEKYGNRGSEKTQKTSHIIFYIRGLIIAITALSLGLYMIFY